MAIAAPVIVVPGITATYLQDEYPISPEIVWSVLTKNYERSAMHPDDPRYEALEPARVLPGQVFEIVYKELIEELRFNLSDAPERPVPVFPFGYDWRQPLERSVALLDDFIEEVVERTKLLRHYHAENYAAAPKVNLIGHSMGGLIIAGYLARHGGKARVGKVATLATPFRGSFEAPIKVTTGTANLGGGEPSSREREAARATPSLYHLLPNLPNALRIGAGLPQSDLFDLALWQPSILETLAGYCQRFGLPEGPAGGPPTPGQAAAKARTLFSAMLGDARDYRGGVDAFRLQAVGLSPSDWLCVVGAGTETRVAIEIAPDNAGRPQFVLRSADRADDWADEDPVRRRRTGDGTVPFDGAVPHFLELANLVCVTPDDFGYWEVQDKLLAKASGLHGILPNMNLLHRLVVRHFTGRADPHGNTWGRPAPGVTAAAWRPPIDGLRAR